MKHSQRPSIVSWLLSLGVIATFTAAQFGSVEAAPMPAAPKPSEGVPLPLAADAPPIIDLNVPATVLIGEDVSFSVTFDNQDSDPGYGPFIDLIIDTTGTDGYDGLGGSTITASYLGTPINSGDLYIQVFDGSGQLSHPFVRLNDGSYLQVLGQPGDTLVSIRLPFGSFTPSQPPATLQVTVDMSNLADVGMPLTVQARGGYEFGYTPLDDWCCGDAAYPGAVTGWDNGTVTPTLFTLSKTYSGPEDETATGPNYPRQYIVTVDIADGQILTDLDLTDVLPDDMQFVSVDSVTIHGAPAGFTAISTPSTSSPGGTLTRRLATVTGTTSGDDASMTFTYYVPRDDSIPARILDPVTGDDFTSCNNAATSASWTPLDTADTGGVQSIDPADCEHELVEKSIAMQKSVSVLTAGNLRPGSLLEYTLQIQVSDFFAFDGLVVMDMFSDGQHFDATFTPTLQVQGNTYTLGALAMNADNYTVDTSQIGNDTDPITDGSTTLIFELSDELITRGQSDRLIGGCVPTGGSASPDCSLYDNDATTATIVFRTVVLEDFTDTYPSTDSSVDQGDLLENVGDVSGYVLDTLTFARQGSPESTESDGSGATLTLGRDTLEKSIFAINGSTTFSTPVHIRPGDTVTYRLTYVLPTSDVEELEFEDFLPLPVFHVDDPDEDGSTETWVFDPTVDNTAPGAGVAKFGLADTFFAYSGIVPTISTDAANNLLGFYYGDFDDTRNEQTTVDLLFTVTVSDEPFADGLYLTNEAHAYEGSTNNTDADSNFIVQIVLDEPLLVTNKAVVWSDNLNAVFTPDPPAPVTFSGPTSEPRWSGTIDSSNVDGIDSDITGVDASDIVTFAIIIENQGHSDRGAFDITLTDLLQDQYQIPTNATGLNLQIYYGDGHGFDYDGGGPLPEEALRFVGLGGGPDGIDGTEDDLFEDGIQIVDPDPDNGACQSVDGDPGRNIIIITYDLQLEEDIPPGDVTNTATLEDYAGTEGGPTFVPTPSPLHDDATTTVVNAIDKTLVSTEIVNAVNENGEAVIGELVTYRVTLTLQEGETPGATLVDTVDSGLAFVDCGSVMRSTTALTTTWGAGNFSDMCNDGTAAPFNPIISNSGGTITFDLGTITNADTDNSTAETLVFEYSVVVLNLYTNQSGTLLNNTATFAWSGGPYSESGSLNDSAEEVVVIEPTITTTKTAAPTSTDAGNDVTFTVTITNTSQAEAYDLTWSDTVPAGMTYQALPSPLGFVSCPASTYAVDDSAAPILTATISDLGVGETCTLTFVAQVDYSVTPGSIITNTAETRWTSLPGTTLDRSAYNAESDERTGEDGFPAVGVVDDYRATASATVTINQVAPTKSLVDTSEAFTSFIGGQQRVAIGEIVRYRLVVSVPEGTSPDFQVRDWLPPGLTFLNDNTATLAFISSGSPIQSSDPLGDTLGLGLGSGTFGTPPWVSGSDPTGIVPTFILPDVNVGSSSSIVSDNNSFSAGSDVFFKLGTLLNTDSDGDLEYVVIEFNALVNNNPGTNTNDLGDSLGNRFTVLINGSQAGGYSNYVYVYVVEPVLTLTKTPAIDPTRDAGDTVTYTLTVSATSGNNYATAFDLNLTDSLDSRLVPVSAVISSTSQTSPCRGGITFTDNVSLVGQDVTLTATCLDPGSNIVVTVTATVIDTVPVPSTIPNSAILTWTSLPGDHGTLSNPTGSQVTGTPGTDTGERTGSGTAPNDYTTSSSGPLILASPVVVKQDASPTQYTIGETVIYDIWVTLPEGVTQNLVVTDNIPTGTQPTGSLLYGMRYVSYSVLTSDPSLADDFEGTLPVPTFACAGTCATGDDITLTFGDVTTDDDNDTATNTFIVRVTLLVEDVPGNQDLIPGNAEYPTRLVNTAAIVYTGGSGSDSAAPVFVIEPRITTTKDVSPTTSVQAGDTLTYTVRFTNTGSSTAYEVTARDDLPQGVDYDALVYCRDQLGTDVPTSVTDNGTWLAFDGSPAGSWDIAVGDWIECQYTAVAQTSLYMHGSHTNTVDADWSSLDGSQPEERTYDDSTSRNFDGTQDTDTASFTADAPTFVKDDNGVTQVVIGDTITFHLHMGGEAGTYRDVVIADQLPAGFIYNNDASVVLNGAPYAITPTVSVPNDGSAQVDLTWTFGNIYKDASDMVITYSARVADVAGNSLGDVMINDASLDHDYADGTPAPQLTDQESSTITEPVIATVKDVTPTTGVAAGDSLTYTVRFTNTGTSTAFEVTALDTLAQGMGYDAGSASCTYDYSGTGSGAIAVIVTDNGDGTLTFSGNPADAWDIPASDPDSYIECTYTVTAQPGLFLDGLHTNTIDADWSSQNGTQPNERTYDDSLSRPGVDETPGADDDDASFTTEGASISKSDGGVTQVVIGQTVHITLTITAPLGTLQDTVIIDTLPAGLIYYDDGLGGSQAISGILPEAGSPGFSYSVPNDGSAAVTLTWDLGAAEVTNSTVIITYDAIIANVAGNYDDMIPGSPDLVNEVHLYYTDVSGTPQDKSASDSFDVVEADLLVDKTHAAFAVVPDAGDEVHYIVTITPSAVSHVSAYDVVFTDILPADVRLDLTGHSIIVTPVGDAGWTGSVSIDTSASSEAGNTVEVTISDIPNTAGTSVQIEYWAIVENTVTPAQLIENTGSLTWTSTSGTNANERGGTGGGPNTYNTSDTDSFSVHDPSFSKSVYPGSDLDYAIGETVTFSLEVTLPEGTTPSLSILDELPPGLQYVDGSVSLDRTGFAGTVPDPTIIPTLPIGSGTDVRFDFGSTEVDADNDPANNTFSLRFQAVVLNEAGNQQSPPPLENSATTTVFDDASPTPNVVWTGSDTATINIIEPLLTIGKAASDIYPGADQVVTFTLTVQHDDASNADAFDVLVFDDLPAELTLNLASVSVTLGGTATGYTNTSHDNRVEVTVDSIPDDGSTVTIEFTATVSSSVTLGQVITNTATTTWTSTPGTNGDERTGTGGGANDYAASVSIDLTIQKSLSKTVVPDSDTLGPTLLPQMAIGEILTYQIEFHVPVGTTTGVTVTDSLDLGLAYVDCLSITPSPDISTTIVGEFTTICDSATVSAIVDPADPANPASAGRQVVFNFGDLTNTSGNMGLITLQYLVVVLDVEENQETTTGLNNDVLLDWSAGPLVTESTEPLNIVEPDLTLLKTASTSIALPDSVITFTLTIEHTAISTENAYDVILEDVVPPGLEYIPGTLLSVSGIAPTLLDESLAPTLRVTWDELPLTPSDPTVIQFQARMGNITPGTNVSNMASVEWSSMPGDLSAPQSVHNVRSTERRYDPLSTIDLYYVTSTATIGRPALPDTGFAPGVVTELPPLVMENRTQDLGDLWLEIPSLGIEMPIVGVPMSTEGWDLTWLGDQAGYLEGTAFPTADGNTGLTGHVYLPNGQPGPFANLHRLSWGQKIIIHFNNMQYVYKVQSVRRVWPDDLSVLSHMDAPTLTLITCQGYDQGNDSYMYRIAVQAILVDVLPENQGGVYDLGK